MFDNLGRALYLIRDLRGKTQAAVAREAGIEARTGSEERVVPSEEPGTDAFGPCQQSTIVGAVYMPLEA
jgi:hypothetical protein